MSDSIVIIPTYNEKENIENIIRAVFGLEKEFHILIIDDGSPDGTADIVKRLQSEFPERLFMVERKGKLGLGTAYICGFKWAIEHKYDFVFTVEAAYPAKDVIYVIFSNRNDWDYNTFSAKVEEILTQKGLI